VANDYFSSRIAFGDSCGRYSAPSWRAVNPEIHIGFHYIQHAATILINVNLVEVLNKPEYWFRPLRIFSKIRFLARRRHWDDLVPVRLPWGDVLYANAAEAIGRSLATLGVYELAVSEVLWRLVDAGDICLDIGANIGYMTSLLSARTGDGGRVFAFEPHPKIFGRLKTNVEFFSNRSRIVASQSAIGAAGGQAELVEPVDFETNEGVASVSPSFTRGRVSHIKHQVAMQQLDSIFSNAETFGVVKIDVEGAELDVFHGAERLLSAKRVRDIVWEDQNIFPSESVKLLLRHGYNVYRFSKKILGPAIWDPFATQANRRCLPWEPVNFLATLDPTRAVSRLGPRGWRCLKRKN
jgi:FkbM family methyltransferase